MASPPGVGNGHGPVWAPRALPPSPTPARLHERGVVAQPGIGCRMHDVRGGARACALERGGQCGEFLHGAGASKGGRWGGGPRWAVGGTYGARVKRFRVFHAYMMCMHECAYRPTHTAAWRISTHAHAPVYVRMGEGLPGVTYMARRPTHPAAGRAAAAALIPVRAQPPADAAVVAEGPPHVRVVGGRQLSNVDLTVGVGVGVGVAIRGVRGVAMQSQGRW
jgi:hypothetical protein